MVYAVIGAGMIGAAAARHLAQAGHEVILIGPDEPNDKSNHTGPFASHHDSGRITRGLATDPFWAQASLESIARYRDIETASGIEFFNEVGCLMAGPRNASHLKNVGEVAQGLGLAAELLSFEELCGSFPYFSFDEGDIGYLEKTSAGTIDPRKLVAAQIKLTQIHGGRVLRADVKDLAEEPNGMRVVTTEGALIADQVLVATGGFTTGLIPNLDLEVYARTVALFEVTDREANRLRACPSLIYLDRNGNDPYLLPPILYPDGKYYLKLGGDPEDRILQPSEMTAWFQSGGSGEVGAFLEDHMRARMPDLEIQSTHTDACVTTFTSKNRPLIQRYSERVSIAVAGCGAGAKCSDELGRLGAEILLGNDLPSWAQ